jgi:hypothetical protein
MMDGVKRNGLGQTDPPPPVFRNAHR